MIARRSSVEDAKSALSYVAPVGEMERYVDHAVSIVTTFLSTDQSLAV